MQYLAIAIGCIVILAASLVKKWYNVTIIFSIVMIVYLCALFGIKNERVFNTRWYQNVDTSKYTNNDYFEIKHGSVTIFIDDRWVPLNRIDRLVYSQFKYTVILKDGTELRVTDKDTIKFLVAVTNKKKAGKY